MLDNKILSALKTVFDFKTKFNNAKNLVDVILRTIKFDKLRN